MCLVFCVSILFLDLMPLSLVVGLARQPGVLRAEEGKEGECECLEKTWPNTPCAGLYNAEPSPSPSPRFVVSLPSCGTIKLI